MEAVWEGWSKEGYGKGFFFSINWFITHIIVE